MINTAFVKIAGKRIGAVAWSVNDDFASFEYDPAFLSSGLDVSPLMMPLINTRGRIFSFPNLAGNNTFKGLPGLLADVLPDKYGNALINAWLARHGRPENSLNPVEMLCYIGKRGMGALEFEPTQPDFPVSTGRIEIEEMVNLAQAVLSDREEFKTNLNKKEEKAMLDILRIGTSAGGARAKAIIAYHPETRDVRSGQADTKKGYEHWMIKFDGVTDTELGSASGYGRVEMAYHLMARDCGIQMMECRLMEEHGRAHFMTKRFDRMPDGTKVHMQSLCALAHFDFADILSFSYEQLFQVMRLLHLPYAAAEQMFVRMVFNVIARNCDDHTKNFAFTMDQNGKWHLAPAFDICHAYRPDSIWVRQQSLSIAGKRQNLTREDLLSVARQMNIKKPAEIIDKVSDVVMSWKKYAAFVEVDKAKTKAIESTLIKY